MNKIKLTKLDIISIIIFVVGALLFIFAKYKTIEYNIGVIFMGVCCLYNIFRKK